MKKVLKLATLAFIMLGLIVVCGSLTSCKGGEDMGEGYMYSSSYQNKKVIKKNYRIRGNNQNNSSTYHSY